MDAWVLAMYAVSVVGALAGMLWPTLVATFKTGPGLRGVAAYQRFGIGGQMTRYIVATIAIALVVSALGFLAFTQQAIKDELQSLGLLAFFGSFTYGFSAGSAIEEPLK